MESSVKAELSSITTQLTDITGRITNLAVSNQTDTSGISNELFEIERYLERSLRRLAKLTPESKP